MEANLPINSPLNETPHLIERMWLLFEDDNINSVQHGNLHHSDICDSNLSKIRET